VLGAAVTHEDDPARAVLAALAITRAIADYAATLAEWRMLDGFSVRVGVDTGLVVVGQLRTGRTSAFAAMGDALNTAARLQGRSWRRTAMTRWRGT
jgi:class 3 adenylate cyclase